MTPPCTLPPKLAKEGTINSVSLVREKATLRAVINTLIVINLENGGERSYINASF
ncbi:hypothetical protein KUL106_27680 [Alteromonas sp. KUL106]|nr:hypothetical protein KUL106_27680 [Alteromonas sp. KUL106]